MKEWTGAIVIFVRMSLPFRGHEPDYRHFRTDRHSGLMPHHFARRPGVDWFHILLGVCILTGCGALAMFLVQLLR